MYIYIKFDQFLSKKKKDVWGWKLSIYLKVLIWIKFH